MQYLHNKLKLGFYLAFIHQKTAIHVFYSSHVRAECRSAKATLMWNSIYALQAMLFFSGNANLVILVSHCILQIFLKGNNADIFISIHTPSSHCTRLHRGTDIKAWVFQNWLRFTCSVSLYFGTMQPLLHFSKMPSPCWSKMAHSMMLHKHISLQVWCFKVWAAWALHLWIMFKSSTLVSCDHNIISRPALWHF